MNASETYVYYFAYSHPTGFGASSYVRNAPITTFDQVAAIGEDIRRHGNFPGNVVIVSWQLLSGPAAQS